MDSCVNLIFVLPLCFAFDDWCLEPEHMRYVQTGLLWISNRSTITTHRPLSQTHFRVGPVAGCSWFMVVGLLFDVALPVLSMIQMLHSLAFELHFTFNWKGAGPTRRVQTSSHWLCNDCFKLAMQLAIFISQTFCSNYSLSSTHPQAPCAGACR